MLPLQQARMQDAMTQQHLIGHERPTLRLRHKGGGKHELYDIPGTACVARAELGRHRLVKSARAVCAEMSN